MKVLITGGAGFIGSNIAREGVRRGHEVVIFDNLSTGHEENLNGLPIRFVKGDVLNKELLQKETSGVDCIFHLAASVGNLRSIENPFADVEANYLGTLNVVEAARKNQIGRIIYSSTAAGYGEPKYLPIDEDHPFNPDSPYGVTKIAGEKLTLCYGRIYGIRVTCLRYFNAYGVNQRYDAYGNVIPIFATRFLNGQTITVFGDGAQTRDFINVVDIARANWEALENETVGYYNVATGRQTTINELLTTLKNVTGLKPEIVYSSSRKGEVLHSVASIEKATKAWQYSPVVGLEEGLKEYWNWFKGIHHR